jgi:SulP family sulfate permease
MSTPSVSGPPQPALDLRNGESLRQLSRDVGGGIGTSLISLVYSLSFAALIFSGPLSGGFAQGVGALLIGSGVTAMAVALFSGFRFGISGPDSNACAVMASMAAAMAAGFAANTPPMVAANSILYILAACTLMTGAFLAMLGAARAGRWIRFIPYPVVGGLIAAAGVLTISGGVRVASGISISVTPQDLAALARPQQQLQLLFALAWSAAAFVVVRRSDRTVGLPLLIIGSIVVFHVVLFATGVSLDQARAYGWLFAPPPGFAPWTPWSASRFAAVDWSVFHGHLGDIGTLFLVTTLTVLINATGLEVETRTDTDLDRELVVQGAANIAAPLVGGFLGYLSFNRSLINYRLGSTSRASGMVFALCALLMAWIGLPLIGYLPRAIFGGLLFYFGAELVLRWTVQSRHTLGLAEYLTLWLILAVSVGLGFGYGLVVGVITSCVMFVVSYSKVRIVKFSFTGHEYRSNHERSADETALLGEHGDDIRIFVLQGFIFFGMADRLYRIVLDAALRGRGKARYLVLDLGLVHGIDASAMASFRKITYAAQSAGAEFILAGLTPAQATEWQASLDPQLGPVRHFTDLNAAADWCEGEVIRARREQDAQAIEIDDWLLAEMGEGARIMRGYLRRMALAPGDVLCRQGQPADEMYFVERGRVAVELSVGGGSRRLRTLGPKTVLGEMGLYRSAVRSANVVVQEDSVIYGLTAADLGDMQVAHPEVAARFHALVVRTLADRLEHSNALAVALQR